ncbi:isopenicillin N synthase family dioxygenase [Allohahella marinimesophila]|uniref:2-oxoglutarate-dependent ethylene/succinate-forming enzyme n=1 Tax=Allohahella marinimesophila TaxID=1054972 RepID=A0ABP7NWG3_9GAMM
MKQVSPVIATVPAIDLSAAFEGGPEDRQRTGDEIDRTCREIGFFTITGHGVDKALIDDLRDQSYRFFNQPLEQKKRSAPVHVDTPRGYRGLGFEALAHGNADATPPDLKEYYHFGREQWPDEPYYTSPEGQQYFVPNIWPDEPPGWADSAAAYYAAMETLTSKLLGLAALGLGLDEHFFDDKIDRHITAMRINHYPAQVSSPESRQLRAGAHTDYGLLTILNGENTPGGLQVQTRQGNWVDVETAPDSFVVNIGDLLMRWTNDRWVSNTHRVVNPPAGVPQCSRLSIAFFHHPNYDTIIKCVATAGEAKYPPVSSGDYRAEKYRQTRIAKAQG